MVSQLPDSPKILLTLRGHLAAVTSLAFNPSALLLASGCIKGFLNIWCLQDGALLQTIMGVGSVQSLAWFSDPGLAAAFARSKVNPNMC